MFKRASALGFVSFMLFLAAVIAGMFWTNLRISRWGFGGNDFYVNWVATRALIVDGISPYSDSVRSALQEEHSGNTTLMDAEGNGLSSPIYSFVLTLPFAMVEDFELARAFWTTSQQLAFVILIFVLFSLAKFRPKLWEFGLIAVSLLFSHISVFAYISGNMIIATSLILTLALRAINTKRDEIAGGLLAFTTLQPQIFLLTTIFILLWALTKRRLLILAWFFGLVFILTVIGILLVPGWPLHYLRLLTRFQENFPYISLRGTLVENWPGIGFGLSWVITIIVAILLIAEWWLAMGKEYRWFLWTACLTLVLTRLIGLPVHFIHNFVLFIPLIVTYAVLRERWQKSGEWLVIILVLLFLGGWMQIFNLVNAPQQPDPFALLLPLPIILLIFLYWIRWWAVRPIRTYMQDMLSRG